MKVKINGHEVSLKKNDRVEAGTQELEYESCNWVRVFRVNEKGKEKEIIKMADF